MKYSALNTGDLHTILRNAKSSEDKRKFSSFRSFNSHTRLRYLQRLKQRISMQQRLYPWIGAVQVSQESSSHLKIPSKFEEPEWLKEANSTLRTRKFKRDPWTSRVICRFRSVHATWYTFWHAGEEKGEGTAINYVLNIWCKRKKLSRLGFEYYCSKRIW
jgi:hypothetical protein